MKTIQKKAQNKIRIDKISIGIMLFFITLLVYCSFSVKDYGIDKYLYYFAFFISISITTFLAIRRKGTPLIIADRSSKRIFIVSLLSGIYSVSIMFIVYQLFIMGKLTFIRTDFIGPFLHYHLLFLGMLNIGIIWFCFWKYVTQQKYVLLLWYSGLSTIFIIFLYEDMLHRLTDVTYFYNLFITRSTVIIGMTLLSVMIVRLYEVLSASHENNH